MVVEVADDIEVAVVDIVVDVVLVPVHDRVGGVLDRDLGLVTVAVDVTVRPDHREAGHPGLREVIHALVPAPVAALVQASAAHRRILRIRANNRRPMLFFLLQKHFCRLLLAPNFALKLAEVLLHLPRLITVIALIIW